MFESCSRWLQVLIRTRAGDAHAKKERSRMSRRKTHRSVVNSFPFRYEIEGRADVPTNGSMAIIVSPERCYGSSVFFRLVDSISMRVFDLVDSFWRGAWANCTMSYGTAP